VPCGFAGRCRRFGETRLHLQGLKRQGRKAEGYFPTLLLQPVKMGTAFSPKRRHRPANPHGAKTQYFYNFLFWFSCKGSTQLLGVLLKHYKVLPLFSSLVLINVISSLCTTNFRIYYSIPASRSSCVRTIVVKTFNFDKFRSGSYRDMWLVIWRPFKPIF
jgi:hypothetical protein